MSKVIPLKVKKRRDPKLPVCPMALGPTRFLLLVELWRKESMRIPTGTPQRRAVLELRKYGYADSIESAQGNELWFITREGMDRLLAPMRLVF
jgi:hypothetical protein